MRVLWSNTAKQDLLTQIRYIATRNRDAARQQRALMHAAIQQLRDHPRMGRPGSLAGTRELVIAATPFILVYEELDESLVIVHLYHGRQNWQ